MPNIQILNKVTSTLSGAKFLFRGKETSSTQLPGDTVAFSGLPSDTQSFLREIVDQGSEVSVLGPEVVSIKRDTGREPTQFMRTLENFFPRREYSISLGVTRWDKGIAEIYWVKPKLQAEKKAPADE